MKQTLQINAHFTRKSSNSKTGAIPVTVSSKNTCPSSCPLKDGNGCYAGVGPMSWHWDKVSDGRRGAGWTDLCSAIQSLPLGTLWRHNTAGDLPHNDQHIDSRLLTELIHANKGKKGFTYTHHDMLIGNNAQLIESANKLGFTVNLSANNLVHADALVSMDIGPVVTVLPSDQIKNTVTPGGRRVVVCPAAIDETDKITCKTCKLCAVRDRKTIIGFPAHGAQTKKVNVIAKGV